MRLYRYLEKQYVDIFFETGKLMLSSFEKCRRHEDARADRREGRANFLVATPSGTVAGLFSAGANTYLLCTSRKQDSALMEKFGVDDFFLIKRPAHFAHAIAESLGGVKAQYLGDCAYSDEGIETSSPQSFFNVPPNFGELSEPDMIEWIEAERRKLSESLRSSLGNSGIFSKRSASYQDEAEFRFAWTIQEGAADSVVVECPDAIRYCSRR